MIIYTGSTKRQLYQREVIAEGGATGFRQVEIGQQTLIFECDLDLRSLNAMAKQAAANKSGKSVDGPLTVRITNRVDDVDYKKVKP